jgi:hypothetical protein
MPEVGSSCKGDPRHPEFRTEFRGHNTKLPRAPANGSVAACAEATYCVPGAQSGLAIRRTNEGMHGSFGHPASTVMPRRS